MANMTLNGANKDHLPRPQEAARELRRPEARAGRPGRRSRAPTPRPTRAFGVLTSSKLLEALDLSKESPKVRERYGDGKPYKFQYDGAPTVNEQLLMARRLVEAGVAGASRCPTAAGTATARTSTSSATTARKLDQCLTALVEDLEVRGMLDDVTVIAWGEFGRTPHINNGRRPRPLAAGELRVLAGGGMKTGQVDRQHQPPRREREGPAGAASARSSRRLPQPRLNPETTTINDPTGRPQHLAEGKAMPELV